MTTFIPGLIMGFREGLEAFLMIGIMLQYLTHLNRSEYKNTIYNGVISGVFVSLLIGGTLYLLASAIDQTEQISKIWESGASLVALLFVTTFIIWMIQHGSSMVQDVQNQVAQNLSKTGLFLISFVVVAREGTEISIFTFAGQYTLVSIGVGLAFALILAVLIYKALINVNLRLLFNITLVYLVLQAGFLLGYAVHEGLSALKTIGILDGSGLLFVKAFDLSSTILNHKEGIVGIPLYVTLGWYSKPEWIQLILQYGYTITILCYWKRFLDRKQNA